MSIAREIASAVAWLDQAAVQELLRLLVSGRIGEAQGALERMVPDLADRCDLNLAEWRNALVEELEFRLAGAEDDDPDLVATREIPDYARFAEDRRDDGR